MLLLMITDVVADWEETVAKLERDLRERRRGRWPPKRVRWRRRHLREQLTAYTQKRKLTLELVIGKIIEKKNSSSGEDTSDPTLLISCSVFILSVPSLYEQTIK